MIKLNINNMPVEVAPGTSILEAAEKLGFEIPTLCHNKEVENHTSCMICLVKNTQNGKLIPSCSIPAEEGMNIVTIDDEIHEARQTGLELLLSDHVGDCEAPCTIACPAHMDIPTMNRLLAAGKFDQALKVVKQNIALPSVLGHICPAPCEGACRRKTIDGAISICLLKRFAGDEGQIEEQPAPLSGNKVAIIGGGAAGLSAAYYLQMRGIQAVVFDKAPQAGGQMRTQIDDQRLPKAVLDREIAIIEKIGVQFKLNTEITKVEFENIRKEYNAVILASGLISDEQKSWGVTQAAKGFDADNDNYQTNLPEVYAVGNTLRPSKLAIRSLAQGKEAAAAVWQMLNGKPVIGQPMKFNSKFGKLAIPEYAQYLKESIKGERVEPINGTLAGLSKHKVMAEATRCLHCDCRKIDTCKLRDHSHHYGAIQQRFYYNERKPVRKIFHETIVYEPEKCIKCGICVRLTEKYGEPFGFTYIGRGFDVEIGVPFNENINEGLKLIAEKVADACPTGALGRK
ncbi:MAG TPA: FAD-dependent oxidoreductase [Prolixibacteraceae bacterium]|nr:FAD-dependent oxidoreductase [Prolixibacteraceae bacterium]